MVQTVHKQDTPAHLQDTTITTSPSTLTPIFTLYRSNTCPVPGISSSPPPSLQFFNFFACLTLGTLLSIQSSFNINTT
jgi:hypothetical protein